MNKNNIKSLERAVHLKSLAENLMLPYEERWRAMADFAAEVNPHIAQEQKEYKEAMALYRANEPITDPDAVAPMKLRIRMPPLTWSVIASTDWGLVDTGKTKSIEQSRKTNKIVRKLDRAFPEYRAYRTE